MVEEQVLWNTRSVSSDCWMCTYYTLKSDELVGDMMITDSSDSLGLGMLVV
jgi:hypothetical protein